MKDPVNRFLNEQDKQVIEERIRAAERTTSGEIVVKVVTSSDSYAAAATLGSSMLSLLGALLFMLASGNRDMWTFLGIFAAFFIVLHELFRRVPAFKRPFVSSSDMQEEVAEAAAGAFFRRGIYNTRNRTGILIYISVFEHRVRVIADQGISSMVDQQLWQEVVDTIIRGIRSRQQGRAIAEAVDRCGAILAGYFPRRSGDRNELSDAIVMGRAKRP